MPFRFPSFSMLIGCAAVLGHLYLYRRLVRDTVRGRGLRWAGLAVLILLTLLLTLRRTLQRTLPPALGEPLVVAASLWMGLAVFLVLALLALDALRQVLALRARLRWVGSTGVSAAVGASGTAEVPLHAPSAEQGETDVGRRQLLAQAVAGGAVLAGGGMAAYGAWRAFAPPVVSELAVRIPRLPRALDGLTIVQLTDLHVGPIIRRRFMDELVRRANALRPDLVAVTGDLVDGDVPTLGESVAALGNLRSRFGTYFVTGNHDYSSGDVAWCTFLEGLGVTVLRNRRVRLGDAGGALDLVGVDDWSSGRRTGRSAYDLDRALAGREPDRAAVLLAHQPANFRVAAAQGVDLQLSGHTHGGQLFPMTLLVQQVWEHSAGLYRHGDAYLYVSRGCGFWGPPMRVGSPPEIVRLTLTT